MRRKILSLASILFITTLPITSLAQTTLSASISVGDTVEKSLDRTVATVSITYTCGPVASSSGSRMLTGTLAQASGREIASGSFGISPVCDGAAHTTDINVRATSIPWHGGPARVTASIFVQDCSTFPCQSASANADVTVAIRG